MVRLPDGTMLPRLGQGTWHMGDRREQRQEEIAALRTGIELGMTVIDTAEMYGEGNAEVLVGEAIAGLRDEVFLVSKVYPHHAGGKSLERSCEASLRRLGTDRLDLYLLHWRGEIPLSETVEGMGRLLRAGKIMRWGVSNLGTEEMEELFAVPDGPSCATNQVLYHLGSRATEYDLQPWLRDRGVPMMAYSPLAHGGAGRRRLTGSPAVREIAHRHGASPEQIAIAWCIRSGEVLAIPKAGSPGHVRLNAAAAELTLTEDDLRSLDEAFPPPNGPEPLEML